MVEKKAGGNKMVFRLTPSISKKNICMAVFISVFFIFTAGIPLSKCFAQNKTDEPGIVILDTAGFWRMHHTFKLPVIQTEDGLKPVMVKRDFSKFNNPEPPRTWTEPDFDDGAWGRFPVRREESVPILSRLCLRGKFKVTNPAGVRELRLSLDYYGGAIVYLNGKEVARGNLPKGQKDLADSYSSEAFVADKNKCNSLLLRTLSDIKIPSENLRAGVNVLAIEIMRAPYPKGWLPKSASYEFDWSTCFLGRVQLVTSSNGITPNVTRPQGFQIWNSDAMAGDFDLDWGDPCEPVRPIKLVGARNGTYSGKVVVGSTKPLQKLKAIISDLSGEGKIIPAEAVRVRYGIPWGEERLVAQYRALQTPYPANEDLLGALAEEPPREIPVYQKPLAKGLKITNQSPVFGAVCPVWVTVRVPKDAKAGIYLGELTLTAAGEQPLKVPVEVRVTDWTLPDPQDYTTWTELVQSPDTLTVEYGMEPWSKKHWELIAKSFSHLNEVGSRIVYVPIIARSNYGNEYGMVYWVKDGEKKYTYDFSIMDKYLDCAEKYMGKPKVVCFIVWDVYMEQRKLRDLSEGERIRVLCNWGYNQGYAGLTKEMHAALVKSDFDPSVLPDEKRKDLKKMYESLKGDIAARATHGGRPLVTTLDPVTKKVENLNLPSCIEPSGMGLWKPLFDQIKERMKKRNLESASMLGFITDVTPNKEEFEFYSEASGGLPWVSHSHHAAKGIIGYRTQVFSSIWASDTGKFGWKNPKLLVQNTRDDLGFDSAVRWRNRAEANIMGGQRGIGRLGADFWVAMKNKDGERGLPPGVLGFVMGQRVGTVVSRFPESSWRSLEIKTCFLAPGSDGPLGTNRLEALREGVQECEARIFIEKALTDEKLKAKLGEELAKRAKDLLDERICNWSYSRAVEGDAWILSPSIWQDRSEKLFKLAGEVEKKLGK